MTIPLPASAPGSPAALPETSPGIRMLSARLLTVFQFTAGVYLALWCAARFPVIGTGVQWMLRLVVPPFARWALDMPNASQPLASGSGDTAYNYATAALLAVVALPVAYAVHRRVRGTLSPLYRLWWHDLMRLTLAFMLLSYGMAKVIPSQFPSLDATRLVQPLGEFSPMGLLWAFMGHSSAYQMFGGWCELLPGLLLLSRRTSMAGALVAIPVLTNVVALNLFFDVPVKLHALHYLAISGALLLPIAPSLLAVLSGRAVAEREPAPAEPRAARRVRTVAIAVVSIGLASSVAMQTGLLSSKATEGAGDRSLQGIWDVVERSGSAPAWRMLSISRSTKVRFERDSSAWVNITFNPATRRATLPADWLPLTGPRRAATSTTLEYARRGDTLTLSSLPGTEPLRLVLHYRNPDALPLRRTPFRWIQDYPHNR